MKTFVNLCTLRLTPTCNDVYHFCSQVIVNLIIVASWTIYVVNKLLLLLSEMWQERDNITECELSLNEITAIIN